MSKAYSKQVGERIELAVIDAHDALVGVAEHKSSYDAETTTRYTPTECGIAEELSVPAGTRVEIKAARTRLSDSQGARGRFQVRQDQHRKLSGHCGWYLFVVYDPDALVLDPNAPPTTDAIEAQLFVPARSVDDLVPSWIDTDGREPYGQLAWSQVFDPAEVES